MRVSAWSRRALSPDDEAVSFINEQGARGTRTILRDRQAAFYLHIDDGLTLTAKQNQGPQGCDSLMNKQAVALEDVGFLVKDRRCYDELVKILGYELVQKPATIRLPLAKALP